MFRQVARLLLLVIPTLVVGLAEPVRTAVSGEIVDPSGTPVPAVSISALVGGRAVAVTTTSSGQAGEWTLNLEPGTYTLHFNADGFKESTEQVDVTSSVPGNIKTTLVVAPRQDVVTVTDNITYQVMTSNSTRTATPLRDVPQSITVLTNDLIRDTAMQNMADVVRYVPGITMAQGEGHRDAPVIRGNSTTSDFYVNGVRDDAQYMRDLYNVERVEAVKGANALTFGRGGGGGVINRVTKQAQFYPFREITLQGGSFGNRRFTTDLGHVLTDRFAFRLNGMYENSNSFRHDVNIERYAAAPSLTARLNDRTFLRIGYEHFNDGRVVDRGIPSFNGIPAPIHRSTFVGNPDSSFATTGANLGSVALERQAGRFNIRNSTMIANYEKFYQNIVPGAVARNLATISISGYSNATDRTNVFNQTDVTGVVNTGPIRHTLLVGTELGRQRSDNFRRTAYFGANGTTAVDVLFGDPRFRGPLAFRQAAADADNYATNFVSAVYAQDQVELNRFIQLVAGVRMDRFTIDFHNNRNNENLSRADTMVSPRAGLVIKPIAPLSFYTSYSVSYLPSSGDQFSSLTATSQTLRPEKFSNYEAGLKWDISRSLTFTGAAYRLDRENTTARDPNNPAITVQTGSQRSNGIELGVNGNLTDRWTTVGGYSWQEATITSATLAAARGAFVALVPKHSASLWNNYRVTRRLQGGLGLIHQGSMWTGIDNTVRLPQFTRADLAAFYTVTENTRLQVNVENLLDRTYYSTAHSNNNILPGAARLVRVGLSARF